MVCFPVFPELWMNSIYQTRIEYVTGVDLYLAALLKKKKKPAGLSQGDGASYITGLINLDLLEVRPASEPA